jgi:RNA polymerase sigma factor (sigma-70 family)
MIIEADIIHSCKNGERSGQEKLYRICYSRLMAIVFRYLSDRDVAAEVLNKAMFKVFTRMDQFQGTDQNFFAWIKRIVINQALDHIRQTKKHLTTQSLESVTNVADTSIDFLNETGQEVQRLLAHLPETTACVFCLYALDGHSHAEIAELLQISIANSKWHLFSARKKLQVYLTQNQNL